MHQPRRPLRLGAVVALSLITVACASAVREDWQLARESDTVEAYRAFLEEHADSMHGTPAQRRILELELAADWRRTQQEDSIASYEAFLLAHPLSVHAEETIARLRALYVEHRAAAMGREWKRARDLDSVESYEGFLATYPNSPRIQAVRERLEELPADPRTRELRASLRDSRPEWLGPDDFAVDIYGVFTGQGPTRLIYKNEERRYMEAVGRKVRPLPEDYELLCLRFVPPFTGIAVVIGSGDTVDRDWLVEEEDRGWLDRHIELSFLELNERWLEQRATEEWSHKLWVGLSPQLFPSADDGTFATEHRSSETVWASTFLSARLRPLAPRDVLQVREIPEAPFPQELLETLGEEMVAAGDGDSERTFPPRPAFLSGEVSPVPVDYEPPRREGARARAARLLLTIGTPSAEAVVVRGGDAAVAPMLEVLHESAGEQLTMGVRALLEIGDAGVAALGLHLRGVGSETRSPTLETLETLGGAAAAEAVASLLDDWWLGEESTATLRRLSWRPSSPKDRVHLAVARRDRTWLLDHWSTAEEVLLADVQSGDSDRVRLGVNALIASGRPEVIDDLLKALDPGSALIARIYLNSGHGTLEDAARSWASENGYRIFYTPRGSSVVWGRF